MERGGGERELERIDRSPDGASADGVDLAVAPVSHAPIDFGDGLRARVCGTEDMLAMAHKTGILSDPDAPLVDKTRHDRAWEIAWRFLVKYLASIGSPPPQDHLAPLRGSLKDGKLLCVFDTNTSPPFCIAVCGTDEDLSVGFY